MKIYKNGLGYLALLLVPLALAGCMASLTAYPERSYDPKAEMEAMKAYLSPDAVTKYTASEDYQRNGLSKRQWRDAVVNARILAINLHFNDFQQALFQEGVGLGLATDWVTLALGGAGALSESSAQTLSAISTVVIGGKAAFDKNAYFDKTMPTLLATMVAKRKQVLVRIKEGLTKGVDEYPLELALSDLDTYYNAGSIPGALMEVAESAGKAAKEADKKLEEILVVSPVPEPLQKRREAAAAYVKSLNSSQLRTLAKSLGQEDQEDHLVSILTTISAAESESKFELIAQKLNILFGKEV